jgi:hypothetical protein
MSSRQRCASALRTFTARALQRPQSRRADFLTKQRKRLTAAIARPALWVISGSFGTSIPARVFRGGLEAGRLACRGGCRIGCRIGPGRLHALPVPLDRIKRDVHDAHARVQLRIEGPARFHGSRRRQIMLRCRPVLVSLMQPDARSDRCFAFLQRFTHRFLPPLRDAPNSVGISLPAFTCGSRPFFGIGCQQNWQPRLQMADFHRRPPPGANAIAT